MALDPYSLSYGRQEGSGEAQVFGKSSFDPVKYTERTLQFNMALAQQRKKKLDEAYKEGKKELKFDEIAEWDDEQTSADLQERMQNVKKEFTGAYMTGANVMYPTTRAEAEFKNKLTKEVAKINQDVKLHNYGKEVHEDLQKQIAAQILLPEDERTLDIEATRAKALEAIAIGDPQDKIAALRESRVFKQPTIDILDYTNKHVPKWLKEKEEFKGLRIDKATGKVLSDTTEGYEQADVEKAFGEIYDNMPETHQIQLKRKQDNEKTIYGDDGRSPRQYYIEEYGYPTSKHKKVAVRGGTSKAAGEVPGPPRDENNQFIPTNDVGHIYTPATGQVEEYGSQVTFHLQDIFPKNTEAIPLSVTDDTRYKTQNLELEPGRTYFSMPTRVSFYPVADEDMGNIKAGERITAQGMQILLDAQKKLAGTELMPNPKFHYEPFLEEKISFDQQIIDEDTIKTWKDSFIRPYWEVANALKQKKDKDGNYPFVDIDTQIREAYNQLNRDLSKGLLDESSQSGGPTL